MPIRPEDAMSWIKFWFGIEEKSGNRQINRIKGEKGKSKHSHDYYTWGNGRHKEGSVGENAGRRRGKK